MKNKNLMKRYIEYLSTSCGIYKFHLTERGAREDIDRRV